MKKINLNVSKEELYKLYIVDKLSTVDLSKIYNVSRSVVTNFLKEYDIPLRSPAVVGSLKVIKTDQVDEKYFSVINTEHKAYILGFIMGDGCLTDKGFCIALAKGDVQILEDIARAMNAEIYLKESKSDNEKWQDKVILHIRRKCMLYDLNSLGVALPPKSGYEQFIKLDSDELQWHFIRGIFDADGCVRCYERNNTRKYSYRITSSKTFCEELKNYIQNQFNLILPEKCVHEKIGCYEIELHSENTIKLIKDKMYNNATLFLKRKNAIFEQMYTIFKPCPICGKELIGVKFNYKCICGFKSNRQNIDSNALNIPQMSYKLK